MFSEACLLVSGLFNAAIGLYLAFFSLQPPLHIRAQAGLASSRLMYVEYVFQAHGWLVGQIGFASILAVIFFRTRSTKALAALSTLIGDVYFAASVIRVLMSGTYVPHEAEIEFQWLSVAWAASEGCIMLLVLLLNCGEESKAKKE